MVVRTILLTAALQHVSDAVVRINVQVVCARAEAYMSTLLLKKVKCLGGRLRKTYDICSKPLKTGLSDWMNTRKAPHNQTK